MPAYLGLRTRIAAHGGEDEDEDVESLVHIGKCLFKLTLSSSVTTRQSTSKLGSALTAPSVLTGRRGSVLCASAWCRHTCDPTAHYNDVARSLWGDGDVGVNSPAKGIRHAAFDHRLCAGHAAQGGEGENECCESPIHLVYGLLFCPYNALGQKSLPIKDVKYGIQESTAGSLLQIQRIFSQKMRHSVTFPR